jgi:hypothetical protein
VAPTTLDLSLLMRAVGAAGQARAKLLDAMAGNAALDWECALLRAATEPDRDVRGAALGELVTELDGRLQEGARVPRVCASIATSTGFLCATAALLQGLSAAPAGEPVVAAENLFVSALGSLAAGVAGATFCAAVHLRARRVSRTRAAGGDALVHRLLLLE